VHRGPRQDDSQKDTYSATQRQREQVAEREEENRVGEANEVIHAGDAVQLS